MCYSRDKCISGILIRYIIKEKDLTYLNSKELSDILLNKCKRRYFKYRSDQIEQYKLADYDNNDNMIDNKWQKKHFNRDWDIE